MKACSKTFIGVAATALLTLIIVYLLTPDYDTPESREAFLKQENHNSKVLYEETFGDYVICVSRNDMGEGYHLFKNMLGKFRFDHSNYSNTGGVKGYLEQDGQVYLIHTNFRECAKYFEIVYYDFESSEEVCRDRIDLNDQLTIVPILSDNGIWNTLIFYDAGGNQIS